MKLEELEELKDNFISHHDFFGKGKTDVTYDEFINFFEILSMNYDSDADFEKFITNSFNPNLEENSKENKEEKKEEENKEEIKTEIPVLESIDKLRNNRKNRRRYC